MFAPVKPPILTLSQSRGISLVQLMIAMLLGSILSLAMVATYVQAKQQFLADEAMARMQENGRLALGFLSRELTHAGFYAGPYDVASMSPVAVSSDCVDTGNWALNPARPLDLLSDFDGATARTVSGVELRCLSPEEVVMGTDIFTVKRTAGSHTVKNGERAPGSAVKNNRWYLRIADYGEELSWIYHKEGGLPSADMGKDTRVDYWEFYPRIFYIRNFSQSSSDNIPSLCVESLRGGLERGVMATRCLVEGIEDMQIEFGIDSDDDGVPNQFKSAPVTAEMEGVVAARIYLLVRSINKLSGPSQRVIYSLGQKEVTRNDEFLRRVIATSVQMPNMPGGVPG